MIVGADFIGIAGKLAAYTSGEPEWRTSISRAYFGAFHHAREFLLSKLKISCPANAAAHALVIRALDFTDIKELKTAASLVDTLRTMRNKADYDIAISRHGKQQVAMDATVQANAAKSFVDSIVAASKLKNAQEAIKANIELHLLPGMSVISNL